MDIDYKQLKRDLESLLSSIKAEQESIKELSKSQVERFENVKTSIKQLAKERQIGFPWLANAYDEYFELQEKLAIESLLYKSRPARLAAEEVKRISKLRREAEESKKKYQYLVEYYETIAPFLIDLREEVDINEGDEAVLEDYSEEEKADVVTNFLTKEEYRKLPSTVRNQLALDRFWKRPKSKQLIGRLYERYVGYLYEEKGYDVEYVGIFKGLADLGRDLICKKQNEIVVVQCKNWSKFKTIYEKHIFQFFGTVFQYKDENSDKKVSAVFYSTTKLSKLAKRFSEELGLGLEESHKFDQEYPCIKCNISKVDESKIYHLPFDQQYDNVKIEKDKGEFYCKTVQEAEKKGFRRAFRYKGMSKL